jgi:hypothetical protein
MRTTLLFWTLAVTLVLHTPTLTLAQEATPKSKARIIMGGTGSEPHVQNVMDGITDYLSSVGVHVKQISGVVMPRAAPRNDEKQAQINRFTDWRTGFNLLIS